MQVVSRSDADARRDSDTVVGNRFLIAANHPQSSRPVDRPSVQPFVDGQGLAKARGAAQPVSLAAAAAQSSHYGVSGNGPGRTNENRGRLAARLADDVEAPPRMNGVHVGPAGRSEHGLVAGRHPASRMASRIPRGEIGLGLHDLHHTLTVTGSAHQPLSQKFPRDHAHVPIVKRSRYDRRPPQPSPR